MRICFVSFSYSTTSTGGIERYLDNTIGELIKRGHEVDVITASYDKDKVENKGNLTVHSLKIMDRRFPNKEIGGQKLYEYLKNIVEEKKIDIISAEHFYKAPPAYAFAVNLISMEKRVPVTVRLHNHLKKDLEFALLKDLMWKKIIGVSKSVNNQAYNIGAEINKISLVYPGIDVSIFRPGLGNGWLRNRCGVGKGEILVLHASRIVGSTLDEDWLELKGITTLIEAFAIVAQKNKNSKLLIATARPPKYIMKDYEKTLKRIYDLAELNGIKNKVIVQAFELNEMPLVYNGADIFAMASMMESFGLVYAEAMACGIPVIGTSVGGITEVIDNNVDGFLIEPKKPVELAKRIEFLIKNKEKRESMGREGVKKIKHKFDLKKMVDRLVGVYSSCIEADEEIREKERAKGIRKFLREIGKE